MSRTKRRSSSTDEGTATWWTVGGPCAVVIVMLLFGAVLRSPANGGTPIHSPAERHRAPLDFASIAEDDARRLAQAGEGWTLQFVMACERQTLEPIVEALEGQHNFFLLRYPSADRECYRICWGRFASKAEANGPRAYPDVLRNVESTPWATPVASVLP